MVVFLSLKIFQYRTFFFLPPSTPSPPGFKGFHGAFGVFLKSLYGRKNVSSVSDMLKSHFEQAGDMVVIQRVEDLPAFLSRADEVHLAQSAQLMGDSGFGHAEPVSEGADAHFSID
jgi:hypothetical protein